MHLLKEYNKKYLGSVDYDSVAAVLTRANEAGDTPQGTPPTPSALLQGTFGHPSKNHAFHQEAGFKITYVLVLKSGFFKPGDILNLHWCHPLLLHLLLHTHALTQLPLACQIQYQLGHPGQRSISAITRPTPSLLACFTTT